MEKGPMALLLSTFLGKANNLGHTYGRVNIDKRELNTRMYKEIIAQLLTHLVEFLPKMSIISSLPTPPYL